MKQWISMFIGIYPNLKIKFANKSTKISVFLSFLDKYIDLFPLIRYFNSKLTI